jgi:hypothetical protein
VIPLVTTVRFCAAGFFDPQRGSIASYRVALSTSSSTVSDPDVAPWRDVTLAQATSSSGAGFSWLFFVEDALVEGAAYYGWVQAVDRVGRRSAIVVSSGQM